MLRILVADDHAIIRSALRLVVEAHGGWVVCGEAQNGDEAFALAVSEKPDIAIIDVAMPDSNGIVLTQRLRRHCPEVKTLIYSGYGDDETVKAGLTAGARGFLLKSGNLHELRQALDALSGDRTYFSPEISEVLLDLAVNDEEPRESVSFTPRELQVAQLVAEGKSSKDIASQISISIKTVECYRAAVMRKTGCRNAAEFVRFAVKHKLTHA
jgi:DNA-binding NarL/FixJ family response regulator